MKALFLSITRRSVTLVAFETVLIVAAVSLGALIRLGGDAWILLMHEGGLPRALLIAFVCQVSLYYADLYEMRVTSSPARAVHRHRSGAECHFLSARRDLFLVPKPDHRPGGVRRRVSAGAAVRVGLAPGVRVVDPARRAP